MTESLHVEVLGRGPAVVLLHGWGMNGGVWKNVAAGLTDRFQLYLVDLPGFGYSGEIARTSLGGWASAVRAVVPPDAAWVGWSLGGMVAMAAAARSAPAGLVLVGATPRFVQDDDWPDAVAPEILDNFAGQLQSDYRSTLLRFLALQAKGSDRAREEVRELRERVFARGEPRPSALAAGLRLLRESDLRDRLESIAAPALLIHGARDTLAPLPGARRTAQALRRARLESVPGAGHAPFISHPDDFGQRLTAFLESVF